jgi:hypothetical protein
MWWEDKPSAEVLAEVPAQLRHIRIDALEQPAPDENYNYLKQSRANLVVLRDVRIFTPPARPSSLFR